ncbi:MAG TPA: wax ester/triacylglycerol synthase family O-acyltransferase [Chiayiivirga sp.]|jgi:WS/DGAT/MGAT family acyltransferase|uniref:diacylglycerol O-acyltransferase n=1 Tax=Denitratimonas tolerans TaxID=1338420 RepID=A0AAW9R4G1_9GAMM|nr:wax ester/triacylglycerol synthase family O-acyltransferase [Chiayiivirga sp.]MEB2314918.1 wax ester/triacylglycerol synthase family O-acyltransferase [Xanthomonadaceae bacterium]HRN59725.1 wax ester/triacylglycerol synthase family O-acyltransferase [Chiayiivirga sp.]HRO86636.1 wax ester/triacylglycerol synthase family O-acyltransferase [Chiayiivirga sp.]HRQ34543.1 wax ester/triacylglycerol synthase family O-acyltransferase [Chiayiivirga sp.]
MTYGSRYGREAMSKVDTAWLRMEKPTNLMMITGVLMFGQRLSITALRQLIGERFLAFRRFRQKAVDAGTSCHWETDADFDLEWHVRLTALPGEAGTAELQRLVSQLASTALDHSKPLWQFHLVENYNGGSALIARVHHCYADGIALVQVLLSLTDVSPEPAPDENLADAWLKQDGDRITRRFFYPGRRQVDQAMKLGGRVLDGSRALYRDPGLATVIAREGGEIARELAQALTLSDDPPTALKRPLGVIKRCAWAEPLSLDEVKTVGRVLGCTVNDVLLACAAGALRDYLVERDEDPDGLILRATVPVNLRPLEHAKKLGNHFGLVFLELPVGQANPVARVLAVAENMNRIKSSRQALMTFGALATLGMTPTPVQRIALDIFSRKASAVATNVPGPQMPLYLAGAPITEFMFWVPQTGGIGVGLSILSYQGRVHFGLIADAKSIPDPGWVARRFARQFETLIYAVLMEDWNGSIQPGDVQDTLRRLSAIA